MDKMIENLSDTKLISILRDYKKFIESGEIESGSCLAELRDRYSVYDYYMETGAGLMERALFRECAYRWLEIKQNAKTANSGTNGIKPTLRGNFKVLKLIQAEREKQIARHGYSKEHDKIWVDGELAQAAAVYAMPASKRRVADWPFDMKFYRPERNRVDELLKAAALIVAEIERLDRRADDGRTETNR